MCPAANQEGATAARNMRRIIGHLPTKPFRYRNKGDTETRASVSGIFYCLGAGRFACAWAWTAGIRREIQLLSDANWPDPKPPTYGSSSSAG